MIQSFRQNCMTHQTNHGWVEVICGSMFSGKTEELLRRIKRAQIARQKVLVFKPRRDDRYGHHHVQSHDLNKISSFSIENATEILEMIEPDTRMVGIDEAQFFDLSIVDVSQKLANRGIIVCVAGLDMDFLGNPFGPMPQLLAVAEHVTKFHAVCMICGHPASRTQRIKTPGSSSDPKQIIMTGAEDLYEARCRKCHEPEAVNRDSSSSV